MVKVTSCTDCRGSREADQMVKCKVMGGTENIRDGGWGPEAGKNAHCELSWRERERERKERGTGEGKGKESK